MSGGTSTTRAAAGILVLVALASCGRSTPRGAPGALLVTLDTTRADVLGSYGRSPSLTPHLDRFALESEVYDDAYTVAPLTLPSHASMLTGLVPLRHGVRDNGITPVPQAARTLAEAAQDAGIQTAAFVAAVVLEDSFGLDQGFDLYDAPLHVVTSDAPFEHNRRASEIVDRALAWFKRRDTSRPFLVWVHFFDPHVPYEPLPEFTKGGEPRQLYEGEIRGMDRELGRLLDGLGAGGHLERTTVMIVADHGEALGDNDELSHGSYCYQPVLRVPMMLRTPDRARAGRRVDSVASVVDVAPTLAEALGLPAFEDIDGVSLLDGPPAEDRGAYFECYSGYLAYGWSQLAGWVEGDRKLIWSSRPELYDLSADPGEANDLYGTRDAWELERGIADVAARPRLDPSADPLDEELVAKIRSLGYAAAGGGTVDLPEPLAPSTRPSPRDRKRELMDAYYGNELLQEGRVDEAIAVLGSVVEGNPDNAFARDHLATALIRKGSYREAIPHLTRLLQGGVERPANHYNLGACLAIVGRTDDAIAALYRATQLAPAERLYAEKLAGILTQVGREPEARQVMQRYTEARGQ